MKKKLVKKTEDIVNFIEGLKDYDDSDEFKEYMRKKEIKL